MMLVQGDRLPVVNLRESSFRRVGVGLVHRLRLYLATATADVLKVISRSTFAR